MCDDEAGPDAAPPSAGIARIRLRAEVAEVRIALAHARAALEGLDLTAECLGDIELVLAEVLNNIVEHACRGGPGTIEVRLGLHDGALMCEVRDTGRPMPDGAAPRGAAARLDQGLSALPEGGFGWFLIRQHTRALHYDRERGINRLWLSLPLQRRGGGDI